VLICRPTGDCEREGLEQGRCSAVMICDCGWGGTGEGIVRHGCRWALWCLGSRLVSARDPWACGHGGRDGESVSKWSGTATPNVTSRRARTGRR
jgi:hypothetical protein